MREGPTWGPVLEPGPENSAPSPVVSDLSKQRPPRQGQQLPQLMVN